MAIAPKFALFALHRWRRGMSLLQKRQPAVDNLLLAGLPAEDYQRLLPQLEPVPLEFKDVLYQPGEPMTQVYFPSTGVVSWIVAMRDDQAIEVATIGQEGMVGLPVFLGGEAAWSRTLVQVQGQAVRLKKAVFEEESRPGTAFHDLLIRYTRFLLFQTAQSVACNGLHSVRHRCCRWLLMTHDRVKSNPFPITQEFMAEMLGVRRASVAEVARDLQKSGLIHYRRGKVTVSNRAGLEKASCECYAAIKAAYEKSFSHV
jgi:CRP-like cAMP-binding protein